MIKKLHLGGSSHIKDLHSVKSKKTLEEVKQPVTTETADISYSEYLKEHGVPIEGDTDYNKYLREHGVTEKTDYVKLSKEFKEAMLMAASATAMMAMSIINPFGCAYYSEALKNTDPETLKKFLLKPTFTPLGIPILPIYAEKGHALMEKLLKKTNETKAFSLHESSHNDFNIAH